MGLIRYPELECWSGWHSVAVVCVIMVLLPYYFMSTFIYPNLQFANKSLDLKYNPAFMILQAQIKLVLTGIAVFFPDKPVALLATTLPMYLLLAALNHTMGPCFVPWVNTLRTFSFKVAAWA